MGLSWRGLLTNAVLTVFSLTLALGGVELGLRLFAPKYRAAAESNLDPDKERIFKRLPHDRLRMRHPDNGRDYWNLTNAVAAHNHREFPRERLERHTRIGIFGDSFTANHHMPVPFSFQEMLDFLLNRDEARFEVLNFGVNGYGPDQSYLTWESNPLGMPFHRVIYVFCINDLVDLRNNDLFQPDGHGGVELSKTHAQGVPWWVPMVSGMHTTYLLMEAKAILSAHVRGEGDAEAQGVGENLHVKYVHHQQTREREKVFERGRLGLGGDQIMAPFLAGKTTPELERIKVIFQALMRKWKREVEATGGRFMVVLLPRPEESSARALFDDDVEVVDLFERFLKRYPGYQFMDIRFKNDGHWNEKGNMLAAMELYRFLAGEFGLTPRSEEVMRRDLGIYDRAFPWDWPRPDWLKTDIGGGLDEIRGLRAKYLETELPLASPLGGDLYPNGSIP